MQNARPHQNSSFIPLLTCELSSRRRGTTMKRNASVFLALALALAFLVATACLLEPAVLYARADDDSHNPRQSTRNTQPSKPSAPNNSGSPACNPGKGNRFNCGGAAAGRPSSRGTSLALRTVAGGASQSTTNKNLI